MYFTVSYTIAFSKISRYFCTGMHNNGAKFKILVNHSQIPKSVLQVFKKNLESYEVVFSENDSSTSPTREQLLKDIRGVDGALWYGLECVDREMLDAAGSQLKVVSSMVTGYDHLDLRLMRERGIRVSNIAALAHVSSAVADMAVGLALAVSRNMLQGYHNIRSGKWVVYHPAWMCGPGLQGSTVGIVGFGDIGSKIAKRIKSFDIGQLLYHNRKESLKAVEFSAKFVPLDLLLSDSDFVFLALPLTPDTKHMFNLEIFKKMKATSILINVCRGDVINQDDLITALQSKMIAGAGLDVMTPEPLPPDHSLTKLPNVVLTPHIGSATTLAREAMARLAAENICNALNNKELLTPIPIKQ